MKNKDTDMSRTGVKAMSFAFVAATACLLLVPAVLGKQDAGFPATMPSTAKGNPGNGNAGNSSDNRGQGLSNAIQHVPAFVAEKLTYMRSLFSSGVNGIGQGLSDWIHSFFKPAAGKNETGNRTA